MSSIGYYRYKLPVVSETGDVVEFYVNAVLAKTCNVLPLNLCTGKRILKYLNKDGQYRFYAFNKYYEENDNPREIGKVSNLIASILNSKSDSKSVGYKSDRTISLVSEPIETIHLDILKDIYTSPRVYLRVGSTTNDEQDWIIVTVRADRSIRRERKNKFSTITIEVTLPETYAITML